MQAVLQTLLFDLAACGGVKLCACAAIAHIDLIHIAHQFQRPSLADILVQGAAKIVGYIVLTIRKRTGTAKALHNGTAFTADTAFDLLTVNRAMALVQLVAGFKDTDLQIRI